MAYGTFQKNPYEEFMEEKENDNSSSDFSSGEEDEEEALNTSYNVILARGADGNFGVKVKKNEEEIIVISAVLEPQLTSMWNVRVGDQVTHINGEAVNGSLVTAAKLCRKANEIVDMQLVRKSVGRKVMSDLNGITFTGPKIRKFRVRSGDSLERIANHFNTTVKQIRSDNRHFFPVGESGRFFPGQILLIRDNRRAKEPTERKMVVDRHIVLESETLESIANEYGVSVAEIRAKNRKMFPVGEQGALVPGQVLILVTSQEVPVEPRYDTL